MQNQKLTASEIVEKVAQAIADKKRWVITRRDGITRKGHEHGIILHSNGIISGWIDSHSEASTFNERDLGEVSLIDVNHFLCYGSEHNFELLKD